MAGGGGGVGVIAVEPEEGAGGDGVSAEGVAAEEAFMASRTRRVQGPGDPGFFVWSLHLAAL